MRKKEKQAIQRENIRNVTTVTEMLVPEESVGDLHALEAMLKETLEKLRDEVTGRKSLISRLGQRYLDHRALQEQPDLAGRVQQLRKWIAEEQGLLRLKVAKEESILSALDGAQKMSFEAAVTEAVPTHMQEIEETIRQCYWWLKEKNFPLAERVYSELKPLFLSLTHEEQRKIYPHLAALQGQLAMHKMRDMREALEADIVAGPTAADVLPQEPAVLASVVPPQITPVFPLHEEGMWQRISETVKGVLKPVHPAPAKPVPVQEVPREISEIKPMTLPIVQEESSLSQVDFSQGKGALTHFIELLKHDIGLKRDEYVQTGVPGLDILLEKGIPQGSTILIAGGTGTGKTILGLQILAGHAAHGEKCLYMSFEESEVNLVRHMEHFGWPAETLMDQGNLLIKRFNPFDISRSVDALLMGAKGELLIEVEPVILPEGFRPTFIVVDSLTAIASAFSGKETSYRIYIEQLFRFFEKLGATSFLITETRQVPTIYSETGVEEFLADGVVVLYSFRRGNVRENAIEVLKLRGAKHQKKIVALQISDAGVVVYPEQEVFGAVDVAST